MRQQNTPGKFLSLANTTGQVIRSTPGFLTSLTCFNNNVSARYVKFYNSATAPTVGTDTPVQVFLVPGNSAGTGCVIPLPADGVYFSNGIGMGITTGAADNDTGAPGANQVIVTYSHGP